jgi:hypothetical protein
MTVAVAVVVGLFGRLSTIAVSVVVDVSHVIDHRLASVRHLSRCDVRI